MNYVCKVHQLGGLSIQCASEAAVRLRVTKPNLLLAQLAFRLGTDISRDELIEMMWPKVDVGKACHSLSQALSLLRKMFVREGEDPNSTLQFDNSCIRLNWNGGHLYRLRLASNRSCGNSRRANGLRERLDLMRRAVRLYRGELLPGFFDDWSNSRSAISLSKRVCFLGLLRARSLQGTQRSIGRIDEALEHALRSAEIAPHREGVREEVLKLFIGLDRVGEAIRHYEEYCDWKRLEGMGGPAKALQRS